ncbi:hypothetical protein SOVF_133350 [Spinacia oleracea]|nr:hypothetical protein SOVF_133350 [Spinacia oleracea]
MGPLVVPPVDFHMGEINWDKSVVGHFFDTNPPSQSMVQHLVDSRWVKRETITFHRTGDFYVFVCSHQADVEAIIELHTIIIDGRVITFRRGSVSTILRNINFSKAWLWIRVVGLPLGLLDAEWALQCFNLIGFVEAVELNGDILPSNQEFRAKGDFQNRSNDGGNAMNFGVAQNGHVEDGIIHVVSDISEDSLSASSATESYVSAESNSAEAGEGPAIDNAAFLGEESDPQTPENYHHPVRFNEGGHILPQNTSTFPGDPYHSYYPSQQQAFNPRFHMRAPSLRSDSSGSNLSEAGLEGNLGRFQSSIRLTFEAGEPSNVRQQLPMTNQTGIYATKDTSLQHSGTFVEGRPQVLRDNVFSSIPIVQPGLLGSWPRPFVELQQTVNELANMDIYSAGKFGDSDRARMYIPSRGFSDTLARRTTHVQPPPNLNIPGTSTGINDLYGLTGGTSDPSTPVIFKQYSPVNPLLVFLLDY